MNEDFLLCETVNAYKWHIRKRRHGESSSFGGKPAGDAKTLCGLPIGWDLRVTLRKELLADVCKACVSQYGGAPEPAERPEGK